MPGLMCFMDKERPCGPDCMAFDEPPAHQDYKDKQWASCTLLVNAHRTGKHLVMLADLGGTLLKKSREAAADAARTNQPPPPVPK